MIGPTCGWAQSTSSFRIATYAAPLSRDGQGLLLRDILKNEDPEIAAILNVINHISPDILLLTDFDFDAGGAAMAAFSNAVANPYPYHFALKPNAGLHTGLDIDGNGYTGDARDGMGYGRFLGDGGMAILSRYPIIPDDVIDLTPTLWRDIPGAILPTADNAPFPSQQVHDMLRVSSSGHWMVPITINNQTITLLAFSSAAPVFDGPEDFNGLRNRDELRLWEAVLNGDIASIPQNPILLGNINADPDDGEGLRIGIQSVLRRRDLQDPRPISIGAQDAADPTHNGNPSLDTADWSDDGPGNLRVSYILPSANLTATDTGVFWPPTDDPLHDLLDSGAHKLVWLDIALQTAQ